MVEKTDAAYRFVQEANRKEAANRAAREKAKKPSPLLNCVAMVLLWFVAYLNWIDGQTGSAVLFLALSALNDHAAYRYGWKVRKRRE